MRPVMLCATSVLKPGPIRVGKIGGNITLPRTVPLPQLIAAAIGVFLGAVAGVVLLPGITGITIGGALGGAFGYIVVSYSPLRGESMLRFLHLEAKARLRRVEINGKPARIYIGICAVPDVAKGTVHILPGAIDVPAGSVDERGHFVKDAAPLSIPTSTRPSAQSLVAPQLPADAAALFGAPAAPEWAMRRAQPSAPPGFSHPVPPTDTQER